jgi:hypothetical protein
MAEPGSNLTRKDETVRGAIEGLRQIPHTIAKGVKRVGRAVTEVTDGMVSIVNNPPENPGAFSKAPPYQEQAEGLAPIERTDEYEKVHPFAPYALSKRDKNTILQKDNGIISSQLDMRSLNTVRIFTGIEMYNLSVRLNTDTSMYNTSPIRDGEEEVFINSSPEVVKKAPEIIMTLTDFNHKYLKWMDGEGTDTPDNIKKRKRDLKNLFKFVFNNSKLNDLTTSFVKKLQRIAHTPLDTEDKLPCQGSPLYEDFKRCLEYRLTEAKKEMEVARATFGEMNSYTQQKTILYDGINDLVRLMNGGYTRGCIKYQYGNKSDYRVVMDLAEQNRIMRLFIRFIQKNEPGYMNSGTLQQSLKDKEKFVGIPSDTSTETFNALYNQLTEILESMRKSQGPSSSEEIESLKGQLKEKELAILALESLLQISIQITHLNEGSLELEERYQRVETKMESEKLFQQYEKFRGLLGGLRLNASMQGLIDCGEKLSGIMIQYSLRKDISAEERAEAMKRLMDVDTVLSRYNKNMDNMTVYKGLRGLYEDIGRMIEKKYNAGLGVNPSGTPAASEHVAASEPASPLAPSAPAPEPASSLAPSAPAPEPAPAPAPARAPAPAPAHAPAPATTAPPAPALASAPAATVPAAALAPPLTENNFSLIPISGNGWCFYASILRGLNEPFDEPACLKFATEISNWLKANKKSIVHKNTGTTLEGMYEITPGNSVIPVYCDQYTGKKVNLDTYIESSITQTATGGPCVWAETGVAGWAAADLKKIQINVYNDKYNNVETYSPTTGKGKTTIHIINTGKNHFDLLIPKNNNQLPLNFGEGVRKLSDEPATAPASARTVVQWANAKGGPLFTNKPNPGVQGGGKPTPQQKLQAIFDIESNSDTKTYCDTVLTLLLIDMKRKMYDFDANKFMKKIGTSLGKTKSCPVVFHILKVILDEGMKQVIDSNAYIFSPQKPLDYTEDTFQNLEQRYAETFDDSEKEAFENMTPIRYYHRTPEEFHDLLGDSPYILSGHSEDAEPELRGVDVDGLYDEPLRMTADEKNLLTCGGIPMGAIIFMYITAVANNKRSDILKSLQSEPLLE